jgi:hypothetical protein
MDARHGVPGIGGQIGKAKAQGPLHQPVNGERPFCGIEPRHAQMAKNDHVRGRSDPRLHLMRQQRDAAQEAGRVHLGTLHRAASLATILDRGGRCGQGCNLRDEGRHSSAGICV